MDRVPFQEAAAILPREMRVAAMSLPESIQDSCEELRIRVGRGLSWSSAGEEHPILLSGEEMPVSPADLRNVMELATQSSFQLAADKLCRGFYPLKGGHRIAVTGDVLVRDGEVRSFRELSSLSIRIARDHMCDTESVVSKLMDVNGFSSTLILAPPGAGKTTLLRALIRTLSDDFGRRVSLADERGEVAALWKGKPQFNVGRFTDVLDGCPKAEGMMLLLRGMNPQVLACDEITDPRDIEAIFMGANCGVSVLATAHGRDRKDLEFRPLYRKLMELKVFRHLVCISLRDGERVYRTEEI